MAKHLDNRELAAFRRDVSTLKKAGILPASIKVRSATPSKISGGKPLKEWVKKFKAATPSGNNTAQIIKVKPDQARTFSRLDYVTDARRGKPATHIMVPAAHGAKVSIDDENRIHVRNPNGIETIHLPVEYHNLAQYITDVMANEKQINAMKDRNEEFGFQLYGSNSRRGFSSIRKLFDYLMGYQSTAHLLRQRRSKDAREMIQNLIIVKGPEPAIYDFTKGERKHKADELSRGIKFNIPKKKPKKRKPRNDTATERANWPEWKQDIWNAQRRAQRERARERKKDK